MADAVADANRIKTIKNGKRLRIYRIWTDMRYRCKNPNNSLFKYYGAKGIKVCKKWDDSFMAFYTWAMENNYSDTLTLDRKNTYGDYTPDNCRWASMKTQCNNKTNNHYITYHGKTQTLQEWADELGFPKNTLSSRINRLKWDVEKALSTPSKQKER